MNVFDNPNLTVKKRIKGYIARNDLAINSLIKSERSPPATRAKRILIFLDEDSEVSIFIRDLNQDVRFYDIVFIKGYLEALNKKLNELKQQKHLTQRKFAEAFSKLLIITLQEVTWMYITINQKALGQIHLTVRNSAKHRANRVLNTLEPASPAARYLLCQPRYRHHHITVVKSHLQELNKKLHEIAYSKNATPNQLIQVLEEPISTIHNKKRHQNTHVPLYKRILCT